MDAIELVPKLLRSAINGDRKMMEATSLMIIRKVRNSYPDVADEISRTLSYVGLPSSYTRSIEMSSIPVDKESRLSLINIEEPIKLDFPVLDESSARVLAEFIDERNMMSDFIKAGVTPPSSIMLCGQPGVGKTYIAHWLAGELNTPLITLDLATSISSYLGQTGQNVKSIFEYAVSQNAILFLDEIDAIAKRRDDQADLGELKRLVNVLLKEIESFPSSGLLIGATNHPELLDKAIWRRFDNILTVQMPEYEQRVQLIKRHLDSYLSGIDSETIAYLAKGLEGINSADVCKLCEHIKRRFIITSDVPRKIIILSELFKIKQGIDKRTRAKICKDLKDSFPTLSIRDITSITQIPSTTVQRYLNLKEDENA